MYQSDAGRVARWVLIEPQGGKLGDFTRYIALDTDVPPKAAFHDSMLMYGEATTAQPDVVFSKYDHDNNGYLEGGTAACGSLL